MRISKSNDDDYLDRDQTYEQVYWNRRTQLPGQLRKQLRATVADQLSGPIFWALNPLHDHFDWQIERALERLADANR